MMIVFCPYIVIGINEQMGINCKYLRLVDKRKSILTEKRMQVNL